MNNLKSLLVLIVCVLVLPLNAQDKKKVAIFDPEGSVSKSTKEIVREEISSVLVNSQSYSVLERSMIDKVLEENKFQMSGLVDDSQISDIGKMMGANLVLATSITIMDSGGYYLSLKMIDVQTANIEKQKTARSTSDNLLDIVGITVKEMFAAGLAQPEVSQNSNLAVINTETNSDKPKEQRVKKEKSPSNRDKIAGAILTPIGGSLLTLGVIFVPVGIVNILVGEYDDYYNYSYYGGYEENWYPGSPGLLITGGVFTITGSIILAKGVKKLKAAKAGQSYARFIPDDIYLGGSVDNTTQNRYYSARLSWAVF